MYLLVTSDLFFLMDFSSMGLHPVLSASPLSLMLLWTSPSTSGVLLASGLRCRVEGLASQHGSECKAWLFICRNDVPLPLCIFQLLSLTHTLPQSLPPSSPQSLWICATAVHTRKDEWRSTELTLALAARHGLPFTSPIKSPAWSDAFSPIRPCRCLWSPLHPA